MSDEPVFKESVSADRVSDGNVSDYNVSGGNVLSDLVNTTQPAGQQLSGMNFTKQFNQLPAVNSAPSLTGVIRQDYTDFKVTEFLSFEPSGEGEHLFLFIEKNQCNTEWVATELQKRFNLRSQDVGYAGKKDRYSLSQQWFSLHLPGREVSLDDIDNAQYRIIQAVRHNKKLRKGVIKYNHFKLRITGLSGEIDKAAIDQIKTAGFPNYFGYQRFGHNCSNLIKADNLLKKRIKVRSRNKRGLYFSAARSFLFNLLLAKRISQGNWNKALKGDCLSLNGSQSYFNCEEVTGEIQQRLDNGDLHISGWMPGKGHSDTAFEASDYEQKIAAIYPDWFNGLKSAGVSSSRRPLRVIPVNLKYRCDAYSALEIEFELPSGSFATSLLREIVSFTDAALERTVSNNLVDHTIKRGKPEQET